MMTRSMIPQWIWHLPRFSHLNPNHPIFIAFVRSRWSRTKAMKLNSLLCFAFVLFPFFEAEGAVFYQEPFSFVGGPDPVEFGLD